MIWKRFTKRSICRRILFKIWKNNPEDTMSGENPLIWNDIIEESYEEGVRLWISIYRHLI